MDRAPATGSAAFGELQSRLARQFGHTTFSFLSAISCRKAENVWPHSSHSISISSLILFSPKRISQPLQSVSAIVRRQTSSNTINNSMPLGLYISVPFCRTKCSYCNFASDVFSKSAYENYVARLLEDNANSRQLASELGCALGFTLD